MFKILMVFVLSVLIIRAETTINRESCGQRAQSFIVGGTDAQDNEFPFIVSLQYLKSGFGRHFCGGSLISDQYILTAAHCIEAVKGLGGKPSNLVVLIGTNDKTNKRFNGSKNEFNVNQWIVNGCYQQRDTLSDDIALLRLNKRIQLNHKNIATICLPPPLAEPTSDRITVAGWGVWTETTSQEAEDSPSKLQKADISIVSEEFCETYTYFRTIGMNGDIDLGKRLCLKQHNLSLCRGDSGGPAFQIVENRLHQFGIASFISVSLLSNRCSKSMPAFYLKTSYYIDWITDSINKYKDSDKNDITTKC